MGLRDYKEFGSGEYYHIYNRGNARSKIFLDKEDYRFFLFRLRQNLFPEEIINSRIQKLPARSFTVVAYCLMSNHFHLLIRQDADVPTSKLLLKVCSSYSKYFNKKYDQVGHLFQDQFKQVLVYDDAYLLWLSAYIHQNPKVAGISKDITKYPWSSYPYYLRREGLIPCEIDNVVKQFKDIGEYQKFIDESFKLIKQRKDLEQYLMD